MQKPPKNLEASVPYEPNSTELKRIVSANKGLSHNSIVLPMLMRYNVCQDELRTQ